MARTKPDGGRTFILDSVNSMLWDLPLKKVLLSIDYFLSLVSEVKVKIRL